MLRRQGEVRGDLDVASGAGLDYDKAGEVLDSDAYAGAVREDERLAREIGITGVPFFVFDMALGVSGAQSPEIFASALGQAWARRGRRRRRGRSR